MTKEQTLSDPALQHAFSVDARVNVDLRMASNELMPFLDVCRKTIGDEAAVEARTWYANGLALPRDRPGLLALFHPVIHRTRWAEVVTTAQTLAKSLGRWVWLTLGEDRWVYVILGPATPKCPTAPDDIDGAYCNDQYITSFGPGGEEYLIGCS